MEIVNQARKFYSDSQLGERYGVHRTAIWRWVKNGDFPKPVKLSAGCTRWLEDSVLTWEAKRAGA